MTREALPDHVRRYVEACETMNAGSAEAFLAMMTDSVTFSDPFNRVEGKAAVRAVYDHMFRTLADVRFDIRRAAMDGDTLLMAWTFSARQSAMGRFSFPGASEVWFTREGLVSAHADYWDSGSEIFAKVPVLGVGFRGLLGLFAAKLPPRAG
jgi:limonene-1,2-epoxide hydrolase